ncbi:hypothetical protein [Haliangium ochraceum]|uniref:hypothetical protein n=1 Tax=Haliangium ochraceum TaxID=80816 RepID=UPI00019B9945|nr:hypothetical protein [Haliangium ochraceum]
MRDISLIGITKTYRSAVRMVARLRARGSKRQPVARETLSRADHTHVVVTSRDGRVHIGRLWMGAEHVELWQIVHGIPCRQRFAFEDVLSCYTYDDEDLWDEPTQLTNDPVRRLLEGPSGFADAPRRPRYEAAREPA